MMDELITRFAYTAARYLVSDEANRMVVNTKNENDRDVVTKLDLVLNNELKLATLKYAPNVVFLSEEEKYKQEYLCFERLTVIVDPLDGSQNYSLGFSIYSVLIAIVEKREILAAAVVTPFNHQMIIWSREKGLWSNGLLPSTYLPSPSYLAYSPVKTSLDSDIFLKLIQNIDLHSTGLYRWGSASNGLLEVLNGRLQTFIGYEIRLWDCVAFIPILLERKIKVAYVIDGLIITLVTSRSAIQFDSLVQLFREGGNMVKEVSDCVLVLTND
jgi:myo-inositol-1(or 4)-monophosphatase